MKTNTGNAATVITIIIAILIVGAWMFWGKTPALDSSSGGTVETSIKQPTAKINGKTIDLIVADTEEKRELGLGGRENLPENQAMLFVFDAPDTYEFWMKDMKFALDIIWLDPNYKVVHIAKNVTPETYPDETFASPTEALYVLETVAGFSDKNNLKIGDVVEVSLNK